MGIPSTEECIKLLEEFKVPENVRQHSFAVNRISMLIAEKLKAAGENIDLKLVNAASLLHDLDKIETLDKLGEHGKQSSKLLSAKGYKKVAKVVKNHVIPSLAEEKNPSWEDKIVNYADKRCLGDKIVSLKERCEYISNRYPSHHEKWHDDMAFAIEKEIFNKITIKPEDIK